LSNNAPKAAVQHNWMQFYNAGDCGWRQITNPGFTFGRRGGGARAKAMGGRRSMNAACLLCLAFILGEVIAAARAAVFLLLTDRGFLAGGSLCLFTRRGAAPSFSPSSSEMCETAHTVDAWSATSLLFPLVEDLLLSFPSCNTRRLVEEQYG